MRVALAVRAAVAAVLAWLLVWPMGGLADQYPYYAPMGALVVATATVASSWTESWRTALAIATGAAIALLSAPLPGLPQLVVVIGVGTWVGTAQLFGTASRWVPIVGLFVMIFGDESPLEYGAGYVLLTSFGALVGLGVNLVWPPLPLRQAGGAMDRLRDALADQLDHLAEGLARDEPPTLEEWYETSRQLDPDLQEMRNQVTTAAEARWANWRAFRWRAVAGSLEERAQRLDTLTFLVEDLSRTLTDTEHADAESVALGPALRGRASRTLAELAGMLRDIEKGEVDEHALARVEEALEELVAQIRVEHTDHGDDLVMATSMAGTVRRILRTLA